MNEDLEQKNVFIKKNKIFITNNIGNREEITRNGWGLPKSDRKPEKRGEFPRNEQRTRRKNNFWGQRPRAI